MIFKEQTPTDEMFIRFLIILLILMCAAVTVKTLTEISS